MASRLAFRADDPTFHLELNNNRWPRDGRLTIRDACASKLCFPEPTNLSLRALEYRGITWHHAPARERRALCCSVRPLVGVREQSEFRRSFCIGVEPSCPGTFAKGSTMPLKIQCPQCRKSLTVPDQLAGRTGKCPGCGASVSIPPLPPPPAQPAVLPVASGEPLVATVVHDAPSTAPVSTPAAERFARLRNRSWKFWLATAAGSIAGLYFLSLLWGMGAASWAEAKRLSSAGDETSAEFNDSSSSLTSARLPFGLSEFRAALGPPGQQNSESLLYSGSMKVMIVGDDITVAFNAGTMEGLFYAAGLFKDARVFRYPEGDEIMDQIDNIGFEGKSARFRYRIETAVVPTGWRQVRFSPLN